MVKKLQKMAGKGKSNGGSGAAMLDSQFAQSVKDSAQQIWSAGLGAFSKAQGEGSKVFEALVKEGMNAQKRTQAVAEEKLVAMAGKVSDQQQGGQAMGQDGSHRRRSNRPCAEAPGCAFDQGS